MKTFTRKFAEISEQILRADGRVKDAQEQRDKLIEERFKLMAKLRKITTGVYDVWVVMLQLQRIK